MPPRVAGMLPDVPDKEVPARIATGLHEMVRNVLGTDDPFRGVKEREFDRFGEVASRAESHVAASEEPISSAVWMAAFGNIMDSGIIERGAMEGETWRV